MKPCSPLKINQGFEKTCRLHLRDRRILQARNFTKHVARRADLGLLRPRDGGDMLFRNVGCLPTDTWRYIPEDITLCNDRFENFKSCYFRFPQKAQLFPSQKGFCSMKPGRSRYIILQFQAFKCSEINF
jgi:hypothetical protein